MLIVFHLAEHAIVHLAALLSNLMDDFVPNSLDGSSSEQLWSTMCISSRYDPSSYLIPDQMTDSRESSLHDAEDIRLQVLEFDKE